MHDDDRRPGDILDTFLATVLEALVNIDEGKKVGRGGGKGARTRSRARNLTGAFMWERENGLGYTTWKRRSVIGRISTSSDA
mmetsp:Transcript_16828/g.68776  ORF Transcript_16828/g.68776 Transcript_16828/m.68776 type:complete len:82 (-) Transcript_16828:97-342(-)